MASEIELYGYSKNESKYKAESFLENKKQEYNEAVSKGFLVNDETVYAAIDNLRSQIKTVQNYSDYLSFIKGTGMTEDEYWNSQFETYKQNETIKNYQKSN